MHGLAHGDPVRLMGRYNPRAKRVIAAMWTNVSFSRCLLGDPGARWQL